jgi:hypothetical protein
MSSIYVLYITNENDYEPTEARNNYTKNFVKFAVSNVVDCDGRSLFVDDEVPRVLPAQVSNLRRQ